MYRISNVAEQDPCRNSQWDEAERQQEQHRHEGELCLNGQPRADLELDPVENGVCGDEREVRSAGRVELRREEDRRREKRRAQGEARPEVASSESERASLAALLEGLFALRIEISPWGRRGLRQDRSAAVLTTPWTDGSGAERSIVLLPAVLASSSWLPTLPLLQLGGALNALTLNGLTTEMSFRFTPQRGLFGSGTWRIDDIYVDPWKSI